MSLNDFQHFIYPFFMWIVVIIGFVAYPILYRQKRNYLNAHRKEITELLYGGDPFPADKKIDWSQQLTMTAAGISALLMIYLEKKYPAKYKKIWKMVMCFLGIYTTTEIMKNWF